jgi:hypothetical protein
MRIHTSDKAIAYITLLSGLTVSAVAIYYSVAGLVAIFSAAVIPIIVMGVALEISKLAGTVWLKQNWNRAPYFIRVYLLAAIAILMLITSMGIFGFLSKAHSDQSLVSGDVQSRIAIYDEKIKTSKDNIEANRKALKQMDEAVDQVMGRSQDEKGADKAVQLRRSQQKERVRLQSEIAAEQKTISTISEERAPIAAEVRKVEAEVGPIKYIAAFIYGDNPDANVLEKAVTWVIIIIVIVFDPLAVILLLASQYSFQWFRKQEEDNDEDVDKEADEQAEADTPPEALIKLFEDGLTTENPSWPTASPLWPFPSSAYISTPIHTEEVPGETPLTALGGDITATEEKPVETVEDLPLEQWNKMIEEAEKAVEQERELEDSEILEAALDSEAAAMTAWKHDYPDSSLKIQRKMLDRGLITELPWMQYLKPQPDFEVEEAKKWAEENPETVEAQTAKEWAEEKSSNAENSIAYMENIDGTQVKKTIEGYTQNAEQGEGTIWQRIQDAKK